jgi:hypothetical protein
MTNISKELRNTASFKQIISRITYQMRANKAPLLFELAIALYLLVPEVCLQKLNAI